MSHFLSIVIHRIVHKGKTTKQTACVQTPSGGLASKDAFTYTQTASKLKKAQYLIAQYFSLLV